MSEEKSDSSKEPEISLEDLDKIFASEGIKVEIEPEPEAKAAEPAKSSKSAAENSAVTQREAAPSTTPVSAPTKAKVDYKKTVLSFLELAKRFLLKVIAGAKIFFGFIKNQIAFFRDLPRAKKALVGLFFLTLGAIPLSMKYFDKLVDMNSHQVVSDLSASADESYGFEAKPFEELYAQGDAFEFMILLPEIKVNIQRSQNSSTRPMAMFELYLEASSDETAKELKSRQNEILDNIQRVAETVNFDDFSSAQGKIKFKLKVRKTVNEILNSGRLKETYFKTVLVKP